MQPNLSVNTDSPSAALRADFDGSQIGFSPNVKDILDNFMVRNQLPPLSQARATLSREIEQVSLIARLHNRVA